jgi:hypothetical protein
MPFAHKYRFTMRIPEAGGMIGPFAVESSEVSHEPIGNGRYDYPIQLVLVGPGGKQAVAKTLRQEFGRNRTTFSGYGNPYQLQFGSFTVESLGDRRYRVTGCGAGSRFDLDRELERFVTYAGLRGRPADSTLIDQYLEDYKRDITRKNPELEY